MRARGEQPDKAIYSLSGALRGDVPLSKGLRGKNNSAVIYFV